MKKEKTKVYTYTRVSTAMQVDGYSLDAQKAKMKAYADYNDYEIVGEYEDAGKSGKSIEGRAQFSQMMEDIKSGKDGVSYVLVFKLSRFGRNAADVLSSLQVMQDFGVNLVCVEDGIDSSKDAGKLMISVLSAVAEIERENIRVQTMEGRIQKAREGRWNGGFAPYGYRLVDGKLIINEEEAEAIRVIYDQYVHTDIGANGIAKYLENHGIRKIPRQNGKNPLFDAHLIRLILKNPVYCGKIAYGRRKTEKVRGTRNEYKLVEQDNYLLAEGLHEPIVSEEVWQAAQVKLLAQAKKYEHVNRGKDEHVHLLSGIVKCPVCGAGMYGNKSIKHKADGTKYKDFYYYGCKHRSMIRGHKCDYKKQIREELLDDAVAEVIVKLVSNPKFAAMMQEKINMKVDTAAIDQEIANYEKQLRQHYSVKAKLAEEIDSLDPDDRHYVRRKADLDDRLYKMYDKIEDTESLLIAARAKKQAIEAEKLTGDNIYKVLIYFEKLYGVMNEAERRQLIEALISEIQIYPERQANGQWLKSIKFKLPIIEEDMSISLDNEEQVETCDAYLQASTLVARPGALYTICPRYFIDPADESGLADFVAMDENGQNRHTLSTISDNWTFTGADEQYLYGFCEDAFGRISLSDGTETYLLRNAREKFLFWGKIAGVWDGQFVTVHWGNDTRVDAIEIGLLSPEGAYTALGTVPAGRFLPYSGSVLLGGTLYYIDNSNGAVMGFSLENGETREVSRALCQYDRDEGSGFHACERWYLATAGGTLLAMVYGPDDTSGNIWDESLYHIDTSTGAASPLSLKREYRNKSPEDEAAEGPGWGEPGFVTPLAEVPQGLFVIRAYEFYMDSYVDENGQAVEYETSRPVYALISAEDYLAGTPNYQELKDMPVPA